MSSRLTKEQVLGRVRSAHGDTVTCDYSTFISTKNKCRFVDKDYGEWWASYNNVANGCGHMMRRAEGCRLKIAEIERRVFKAHGNTVSLDSSTYRDTRTKCRFIDKDYGEWWASPSNVYGLGNGHKKRMSEKRKNTCMSKYGSLNPTGNKDVLQKRHLNNIAKYGTPHTMQVLEIALKGAKKLNNPSYKTHWKTGEQILCQGGYEPKVVDFLNKNKINFLWQSEVFCYKPDIRLFQLVQPIPFQRQT